jgi:putative aldouronate transport system substrate-binding protein
MEDKMKRMMMYMAVFLAALALAACQKKAPEAGPAANSGAIPVSDNFNPAGFPIAKTVTTYTMVGRHYEGLVDNWEDNKFFKTMGSLTNIQFNITEIPPNAWSEKFNLMFVSDDLPDVFFKMEANPAQISSYYRQGYFIDMAPYIRAYAPVVQNLIDTDPLFKTAVTLPDSSIPSLAQVGGNNINTCLWLNGVWLDRLGLSMPANVNELYTVLETFKTKDPNGNGKQDEIPLCLDPGGLRVLMAGFGVWFDQYGYYSYVDDTGKVIFSPGTGEYKNALKWLKKAYDNGLIDKEVFTHNASQIRAKGTQEDELIGGLLSSTPLVQVGGERHFHYRAVPFLETEKGVRRWYTASNIRPGVFAITNKAKAPEMLVRYADYLYTEDGGITLWMGEKDADYRINADGTWDWILGPNDKTVADLRGRITIQPGGYWPGKFPPLWDRTTDQFEQHLIKERNAIRNIFVPVPTLYLGENDITSLASYSTDIGRYADQSLAEFITGRMDIDRDWDSYLAALKQMGVDDMVKMLQDNLPK